jgi:nucleotide-binding universal stress UspA family protein
MPQIQTILVPTDFSDFAAHAFDLALDLARRHHAEIHLLHVIHEIDVRMWDWITVAMPKEEEEIREELEADNAQQLSAFMAARDTRGVTVRPVIRWGPAPAETVVAYAGETGTDLIVMGSHGRRGVRRMLLGSVTEEVVHTAPCPVMVAHVPEKTPSLVRRILVPTDFSTSGAPALDWAETLASGYRARLVLLHVLEDFTPMEPYEVAFSNLIDEVLPQLETHAREALERTAASLAGKGLEAETHVEHGRPADGILDFAAGHDVGLIVMASHGRTGLERLLLGSVAARVMRSAPCPVLIVKPRS